MFEAKILKIQYFLKTRFDTKNPKETHLLIF